VGGTFRTFLLQHSRTFIENACTLDGVLRIAMIGSLLTTKEKPKDIDILVTISEGVDINALAKLGRQLKGKCQTENAGADIFLCSEAGEYLGRTCGYKECHIRASCLGTQCHLGLRVCNDFEEVRLESDLIKNPVLVLWPSVEKWGEIPEDVEQVLLQ